MKNYLVLSILVVLISLLPFSISKAYAVTYDLKDQMSCQAISGTWSNSTSTCVLSSFTLNSGDLLSVDNSAFPNLSLEVIDTIDNNGGTITSSGNIIINNSGIFNNGGTVINYCTGACIGGTIQNNGIITNNKGATINTNSTINNNGPINNSGTINNNGTIDNVGKLTNNLGGIINNSGTIHNNELSAIINNGGIINNYAIVISDVGGTITNDGTIKNMCGATLTSNGDLLGTPVDNIPCNTAQKSSSSVAEFPFAMPILVISFLSVIIFYKTKK